jgi:hypothetical protein
LLSIDLAFSSYCYLDFYDGRRTLAVLIISKDLFLDVPFLLLDFPALDDEFKDMSTKVSVLWLFLKL